MTGFLKFYPKHSTRLFVSPLNVFAERKGGSEAVLKCDRDRDFPDTFHLMVFTYSAHYLL